MEIVRFSDQYGLASVVYGVSADVLRARDRAATQPVRRWLAVESGTAVAALSARLRPDDRVLLSYAGEDVHAYPPLTAAASALLQRPITTFVPANDPTVLAAMDVAGFETEIVEERFRIRFDRVLPRLRRAWIPSEFSIHPADAVDEDRLFALDNALRRDVPGTGEWRGDREWFHLEITQVPPFDPGGYLVAINDNDDSYCGLVRIWRNPAGPRFGLIGVLPRYRTTSIAAALLRQALTAAAQWGHDTFVAETCLDNRVIYRRMDRISAESARQFYQMVRPWEHHI